MNTNYLVNVSKLTHDEKVVIKNRLDGRGHMVIDYFSDNKLSGFIVYWNRPPCEFATLAESIPKCNYKEVTGWALDKDNIDQAFVAAFGA